MECENLLRQLREAGKRNRANPILQFPDHSDRVIAGYAALAGVLYGILSAETHISVHDLMTAYGSAMPNKPISTVSLGDVLGELAWADA